MSSTKAETEPLLGLMLLLAVFFAIAWLVWFIFHPQFLEALRYLRLAELGIIGLFTDSTHACFDWLRIAPISNELPSMKVAHLAQECFGINRLNSLPSDRALNYYNLSGYSIAAIGERTAYYLRWPIGLAVLLVAPYAMFFWKRAKFQTRYNLEGFIKIQAKMWPVIEPIVNFNPAKYSARAPGDAIPEKIPPFAEAFSPEEWIAFHNIPVTNGIPDREATRRAFLLQLGPRWNGIEGQPLYIRALIAAFALKGVQKRDHSDDLLGRVSQCWTLEKGLVLTDEVADEIKQVLGDAANLDPALKIAEKHAYRTTVLLGMLKWARWMGGVLAPSQFLWLRAVDRGLWYPLNNLGRRSFHTEGAGAMAHFMTEENAKKPLPIPRIDTAIVTLNQHLATVGLSIPPREAQAGGKKK